MKLFKRKQKENDNALEELIKKTFCKQNTIVGCAYSTKIWCPKTCGYHIRILEKAKYWTR